MSFDAPPGPVKPVRPGPKAPPKTAAVIAAAVLIAAPLATHFEGYVSRARPDPVGIPTVCYGETENVDPTRIYSKDECAVKLRGRMARDYAPKLLASSCLPQLGDPLRRNVFGALLDAAYNAGPAAVCKSRMAVSIRSGDWGAACAGLVGWYVTGRDRRTGQRIRLKGLVLRREAEAATCSTPVVAPPPIAAPSSPIAAPSPVAPKPVSFWERVGRFFRHLFGTA